MGTVTIALRRPTRQHFRLFQQIATWRQNVIDLDLAVDDRRAAVTRAIGELREAIGERDRAARHLGHLIDWYNDGNPTEHRAHLERHSWGIR